MSTQTHRVLAAYLQSSDVRLDVFEGREHLVAPVVLMVGDIVVKPITSGAPEFVPSSVLAQAPAAWNGRPIIPGHPTGDGQANTPRFLERRKFGRVFNTSFRDGKLTGEVWLDPTQAERVGADAVSVVTRLRKGQTVEISVGAWVTLEEMEGTTVSGERFEFIWQHVAADHVAMLPEGMPGACSIEDGCGAGRTAFMAAQACAPTADAVLAAIARTQYERECRRIRLAAILDPAPQPYSEAISRRTTARRDLSLSPDSDGIPQPYTSALEALNRR